MAAPSPSTPKIFLMDADALADNTDPALLIVQISREDIEAGNIASALTRLYVLTDKRESVVLYRESLTITVDGYNNDPRELPEIPEVRAFVRRLVQDWPYWIWFMVRGMGSLGLLLSLLCKCKVIRGAPGEFGTDFKSVAEVRGTLTDIVRRSLPLLRSYQISEDAVLDSIDSAMDELGL